MSDKIAMKKTKKFAALALTDPEVIIPPEKLLEISADSHNSAPVYIASSKGMCRKGGKAFALQPGEKITLSLTSSGKVFVKGMEEGQVLWYRPVDRSCTHL